MESNFYFLFVCLFKNPQDLWVKRFLYNNNNNNNNIFCIIMIIIYLTANGPSPGGSGYNACT